MAGGFLAEAAFYGRQAPAQNRPRARTEPRRSMTTGPVGKMPPADSWWAGSSRLANQARICPTLPGFLCPRASHAGPGDHAYLPARLLFLAGAAAPPPSSSSTRSIQAFFSCTSMRWVSRSAVG